MWVVSGRKSVGRDLNVRDLSDYVAPRLDPGASVRKNGCIAPTETPGIGVAPDLTLLGMSCRVFE